MTDNLPASIAAHLAFLADRPVSKMTRRERIAAAERCLVRAERFIADGALRSARREVDEADRLWPRDYGQKRLMEVVRALRRATGE